MRLLIACLLAMCISDARAEDESPHDKSAGAGMRAAGFTYAKEFYPKLMKNPGSTEFDWETVSARHLYNARDRSTDRMVSVYEVTGVLRSRNSFNALVPSEWSMHVVERDDTSEMALAFLDGELVGQTEIGKRLLDRAKKISNALAEKQRDADKARLEAMKKQAEATKAFDAGKAVGKAHASKLGPTARTLSESEINRRGLKLAGEKDYSDEVAQHFAKGYFAGIKGEK